MYHLNISTCNLLLQLLQLCLEMTEVIMVLRKHTQKYVLHPKEMGSQPESLLGQYLKQLLKDDTSLFIRRARKGGHVTVCDNKLPNAFARSC